MRLTVNDCSLRAAEHRTLRLAAYCDIGRQSTVQPVDSLPARIYLPGERERAIAIYQFDAGGNRPAFTRMRLTIGADGVGLTMPIQPAQILCNSQTG